MIDVIRLPVDEQRDRSYASWAGKPHSAVTFVFRRAMGTIIRMQPSAAVGIGVALCGASCAGLLLFAIGLQ